MARLALIIPMLTLPLSATAQSVGGNPLIGRHTATTLCVPCHQIGETHRESVPGSIAEVAASNSNVQLVMFCGDIAFDVDLFAFYQARRFVGLFRRRGASFRERRCNFRKLCWT